MTVLVLLLFNISKLWTKSEARYAFPKMPQAHPLWKTFGQSIMEIGADVLKGNKGTSNWTYSMSQSKFQTPNSHSKEPL